MIEILKTDGRKDDKTKVKKKRQTGSVSSSRNTFVTQLQDTLAFEIDGTIDELLTDLNEQEKRFLDIQSFFELSRYKSIIQKILRIVQQESFKTVKLRTSKKNVELVVQEIDARLLDITAAMTRNNKAFDFLKTIDEIRGLVLDLTH